MVQGASPLDVSYLIRHYRSMTTGGMEAVGDAVTGGLVARAVEPGAGEGHGATDRICLNCGTELIGPHCHNCGQAGHVHRTLMAWWHDLAHGVLHLDGKIWRTLPLLAWRPGELTRRYIEGERARFVSPLALFLFSVFLMFAVFSTVGGPAFTSDRNNRVEASRDIEAELRGLRARISRLESERAAAATLGKATAGIDRQIADARRQFGAMNLFRSGGTTVSGNDVIQMEGVDLGRFDKAYRKAKENPSLLLYKLENNAYKFSWALIPLSVPFVWLLFFWKRRFKAYDHFVFVTYSIAFMTLMLVFFALAGAAGLPNDLAVLGCTLVPPIHMYRQLRGAYELRRVEALWRTFFLIWFAFIAATLFLVLLLTMGVLG
jgi:hypothetical protein